MAEVTLPQLGETVTEGTITRWFKKVGDTVAADEPLFEVSTDKVDTEVPSPIAGVLTEIRVPEGETVPVGAVIGVVGVASGAAPFDLVSRACGLTVGVVPNLGACCPIAFAASSASSCRAGSASSAGCAAVGVACTLASLEGWMAIGCAKN